MECRIFVKFKNDYFKFMIVLFHENDSSIMLCLPNKDKVQKRLNYHATGQVNFHGVHDVPTFFQPLSQISARQDLFFIQIKDIYSLVKIDSDELSESEKECAIIFEENTCLSIVAGISAQSDELPDNIILSVLIKGLFLLNICRGVSIDSEDSTVVKFFEGQCRPDNFDIPKSIIDCQQRLHGKRDIILLPPNSNSIIRIFPIVPMRIVPRVNIQFITSGFKYRVVEGQSKNYRIAVDIRGRGGMKLLKMPPFVSVELDAEL